MVFAKVIYNQRKALRPTRGEDKWRENQKEISENV